MVNCTVLSVVSQVLDNKMQYITINPAFTESPTRYNTQPPLHLPEAKKEKQHPSKPGSENASVYFIGTATTIL